MGFTGGTWDNSKVFQYITMSKHSYINAVCKQVIKSQEANGRVCDKLHFIKGFEESVSHWEQEQIWQRVESTLQISIGDIRARHKQVWEMKRECAGKHKNVCESPL